MVFAVPNSAASDRQRFERAIAATPRDPQLHHGFAVWLDRNGEARAALGRYGEAIRLAPDVAQYAYDAGMLAIQKGLEEEALPILRTSARALPNDARVHQLLGLIARALDELPVALPAFERAARLAPQDARIAHAHALTAMEAGVPAAALFDRARQLAPNDATVLLGRAAAQFAEGQGEAAVADMSAVVDQNPGWLAGHGTLARLRWMMGERDRLTETLEAALARYPRDISLWGELIVTLTQADRFADTLAVIGRGRSAAGPHLVFDVNEAVCLSELGEAGRADALFAALPPSDDISVAVRHVRHLLRTGRPVQALAIAEPLATRADAGFIWPYISIGWRMLDDPRWHWLEGREGLIGVYDLDVGDLDALAGRLRALHIATHQPLDQSLRGGTQTDGILLRRADPEIRDLRRAIAEAVRAHVAALPSHDAGHPTLGGPRAPLRFAGSWSVRLRDQAHHANHVHPAGWLSSAFYVALPEEMEGAGNGHAGWLTLGAPQTELGLDLAPFRMVEPRPGRLVLFPSTMWHGTVPFRSGERLTVAFDVARPPA